MTIRKFILRNEFVRVIYELVGKFESLTDFYSDIWYYFTNFITKFYHYEITMPRKTTKPE